ncbi:Hsp20/alpha crystallin family protein [Photobacterium sp. J15]|uniref:Hsp20/alpha crystallin family protein n=1 Tax=Photobacterium sp. J15 TaxID=265901 RepID=UPI0007E43BE1|nr:Hsp20/alpha crystallin family protein [Photobacterium sp. J15]
MFRSLFDSNENFFDQFRRMQEDFENNFFDWPFTSIRASAGRGYPWINLGSTKDKVVVYILAPGMDPKDIELTIRHGLLSVSGQRELQEEVGKKYHTKERFSGKFHRAISLPDYADPEKVEARYTDGILTVTINRSEVAPSIKSIEIK